MERQAATKVQNLTSANQRKPRSARSGSASHSLQALQQSIGNLAMQRLIDSHYIQAKLHVGPPGDQYEQEADRVADTVMRMPDPQSNSPAIISNRAHISRLHRKCTECEEEEVQRKSIKKADEEEEVQRKPVEEEEETVHAKTRDLGMPVIQRHCSECRTSLQRSATNSSRAEVAPFIVHDVLRSSGQPLDAATRTFMEPRFGSDFSHLRIHTDSRAATAARAINAQAFTVGHDIVFGAGRYSQGTRDGQRLLAHEITHVLQQEGSNTPRSQLSVSSTAARLSRSESAVARRISLAPVQTIQRDLATPPPTVAAPAQPALTPAQVKAAIDFNRVRYNEASTRLIQQLVGGPVTGVWEDANIEAIAAIQEEYGFKKDGMVGPKFFRFLDKEVGLEKLDKTDKNCLLAFRVIGSPQTVGPVVAGSRSITGDFKVRAQFSKHCGCADYEYRQFIRGHWRRERGGVVTDLGGTFATQPAGRLNPTFDEDGNTGSAAVNYGHRTQPAEAINHYLADNGAEDQANGCIYESEDTPGGPDNVLAGDVFDIDVNFRGEIQRSGRVIRTLHWSAIRGRFPVP